jgi:hypothetical protein
MKQFNISEGQQEKINDSLTDLRRYSFCKSHAISYAKLVWALAYCKVYFPTEFWLATLNHCHSSYRKWVHYNEAKTAGIELCTGKKPYKLKNNKLISVSKKCEKVSKKDEKVENPIKQYLTYGYWLTPDFLPNMYLEIIQEDIPLPDNQYSVKFRGLIATGRINNKNKYEYSKKEDLITFVTLGYNNGKYIDITINKCVYFYHFDAIEGEGFMSSYDNKKVNFNYNTNKIMVSNFRLIKFKS